MLLNNTFAISVPTLPAKKKQLIKRMMIFVINYEP